jgi:cysteinyl-tRNA synthetase
MVTISLMLTSYLIVQEKQFSDKWNDINDWGYQLQNIDIQEIRASKFDLLVIDYSSNGEVSGEFTRNDVTSLKGGSGGSKLIIAYLSIGEAEDYRYYWQSGWKPGSPEWLDKENPNWEGNYKVKYWAEKWQSIIFGSPNSYFDKIMGAGFDGVYLDIIDAYQYYEEKGYSNAREDMINFVIAIADYAHRTKGVKDFGIFAQNAEELVENMDYLNVLTGIGREEVYFEATNIRTSIHHRAAIETYLDLVVAENKLVLTVDYCNKQEYIDEAYTLAKEKGYVPYCTTVELDVLTINEGYVPE